MGSAIFIISEGWMRTTPKCSQLAGFAEQFHAQEQRDTQRVGRDAQALQQR